MDKKYIIGEVICQRSKDNDCKCCEGNHVYSTYLKYKKDEKVHVAFDSDYLKGILHKFISDKEGKIIKITIEVHNLGDKSREVNNG